MMDFAVTSILFIVALMLTVMTCFLWIAKRKKLSVMFGFVSVIYAVNVALSVIGMGGTC